MRLRLLYNTIILLIVNIAITSCIKQDDGVVVSEPVEVAIGASHAGVTRTSLDVVGSGEQGSTQGIKWSVGDQLRIWAMKVVGNNKIMNGTIFKLATYNSTFSDADFLAQIGEPMPTGQYNYYGVYPAPSEGNVSGTQVKYTIPSVQSGNYDPTLDVMVASATGRELVPYGASYSGEDMPSLLFKPMFHLLRVRIPQNNLGNDIKRLTLIFPNDVVGTAKFDVTNPQNIVWENCSNKITIDLPEDKLLNANNRYVWLHIKPGVQTGTIRYRACSSRGVISGELGTSVDKNFQPQHITPMSLTIPGPDENAYIEVTLSCPNTEEFPNFLGEQATTLYVREWPTNITQINSQSSTVTSANGEFKIKFYYLNNDDYQFNTDIENASITVSSASANADVSHLNFTTQIPKLQNNNPNKSYFAIPYLFYEDFSKTTVSFEYNSVDTTSDSGDPKAIMLDTKDPYLTGWSGGRVGVSAGVSMRIHSRIESGIGIRNRNPGRVDSKRMSRLTNSAKVAVCYDYLGDRYNQVGDQAGNPLVTFGYTDISGDETPISVTTKISGSNIIVNEVAIGIDGNGDNSNTPIYDLQMKNTQTGVINSCSNKTRLSWYLFNNKKGEFAGNGSYWLYIDNIKVSIGGSVQHSSLRYRDYFPNHTN